MAAGKIIDEIGLSSRPNKTLIMLTLRNAIFCESSHRRCSIKKKVFLKISQNSHENTCVRASSLIKLQAINSFMAEVSII